MQALIFMHPQDSAVATGVVSRVQGNGFLENVIGNPLETTIFLSHLIFEGTLDTLSQPENLRSSRGRLPALV